MTTHEHINAALEWRVRQEEVWQQYTQQQHSPPAMVAGGYAHIAMMASSLMGVPLTSKTDAVPSTLYRNLEAAGVTLPRAEEFPYDGLTFEEVVGSIHVSTTQ